MLLAAAGRRLIQVADEAVPPVLTGATVDPIKNSCRASHSTTARVSFVDADVLKSLLPL
jgi:hypothetical protein